MCSEQYKYFEIKDLCIDEDGVLGPAAVRIAGFNDDTPEEALIELVAELLNVNEARVSMISKEKYDAEYGEPEETE